jgi:hypothetical protein
MDTGDIGFEWKATCRFRGIKPEHLSDRSVAIEEVRNDIPSEKASFTSGKFVFVSQALRVLNKCHDVTSHACCAFVR